MSSRIDCSRPATAVAWTHRLIRFSATSAIPSAIAATPIGISSPYPCEPPCGPVDAAIGPSIAALVSSGMAISVPAPSRAARSMTMIWP